MQVSSTRIRFDIVAVEAAKIDLSCIDGFDFYFDLLGACGWTREEFEAQELKWIDAEWDNRSEQCLLN